MTKTVLYSFYRPHARRGENGLIFNHLTGEFEKPVARTKQEFKAECDLNNIIKMFQPHEIVSMIQANALAGRYEDLPDDIDYQQAIHLVREAEAAFEALPSKVRDRFGQDATRFLAFTSDPNNIEEMREMGLLKERVTAQTPSVSPSSPAGTPTEPRPGGGSAS